MEKCTLTIDGTAIDFGHAWVHMQNIEGKQTASYRATIRKPWWDEVFDPRKSKPLDASWKQFLMQQVDEFGTFFLGDYFRSMATIAESRLSGYKWVISTLDDVVENEDQLELHGRAVIFDPRRV